MSGNTFNNQIIKNINFNKQPVNCLLINNRLSYLRPLTGTMVYCTGLEYLDACTLIFKSRDQIDTTGNVEYTLVPSRSYTYSDATGGDGDYEVTDVYYNDPVELNIVPKNKEYIEESSSTYYTTPDGIKVTISDQSPLLTTSMSSSAGSSLSSNMTSNIFAVNRTNVPGYLQWKKSTDTSWNTVTTKQVAADSETTLTVESSGYYNTVYNLRFMTPVYNTRKKSTGKLYEYSYSTTPSAAIDDSSGMYHIMGDNASITIEGNCTTTPVEKDDIVTTGRLFSQEATFYQLRAIKPPTMTVENPSGSVTLNQDIEMECNISNQNVYSCYIVGSVAGTKYSNTSNKRTINGNGTITLSYNIRANQKYELESLYLKDNDSVNTQSSTTIYFTRNNGILSSVYYAPIVKISDNSNGTTTSTTYPRIVKITNNNSYKCYVLGTINGKTYNKYSNIVVAAGASVSINIDVSTNLSDMNSYSDEKIRFMAYIDTGDITGIYSSYTTFNIYK